MTNRTRARSTWPVAATLAVALLAVAACGSSGSNQDSSSQATAAPTSGVAGAQTSGPPDGTTPQIGGKVVYGMEAEADGVDPSRLPLAVSGNLLASAVFDSLVTLDADGNNVPYLAKSIEPSADYKTWTITLPAGLTFTSGTPLDAEAVKANLEAYRKSAVSGAALKVISDVKVTDPTTVVVSLSIPWVRFNDAFGTQIAYVMDPAMLADPTLGLKPIGSGPFIFDSHTTNESWSFKRNPNFRLPNLPRLDAIEFRPIPDDAARLAALESGDVDIMQTNRPDQILQLRDNTTYKKVEFSNGEKDFLVMNTTKPPFDNLKARQAVAYGANVPAWLSDVNKGVKPPAYGPMVPGQPGYQPGNTTGLPQYDPAKAKQLAQEYQAETGKPLEFEYVARDDTSSLRDAQFFVQNWTDAGMKVTLKGYPQTQLIAQTATGNYQLSEWRLFGMPDPDADSYFWRSSSIVPAPGVSLNFPRYSSPEVDAALDTAVGTTDEATRAQAYTTLQDNFGKNVPYLWLGRTDWMMAASPSVNGIYVSVNGSIQTLGPKTWLAELWKSR
ncbi:MAG: ABC transporter substrate-binding protein [Acidimicrobiales bacterium]